MEEGWRGGEGLNDRWTRLEGESRGMRDKDDEDSKKSRDDRLVKGDGEQTVGEGLEVVGSRKK